MVLAQAIKSTVLHQLSTANREGLRQPSHRYEICGDKFSDLKFSASLSRQREVWLSQLRVGKCMLMGSYRSLINSNNSPLCRWCGVVNETIPHVYTACRHPGIIQLKVDFHFVDVTVLYKAPLVGLRFLEGVLKLLE
jgi:hypothetical protein